MLTPIQDKVWFSPAKMKVAISNGYGVPIVKIPGSGLNVYGQAASAVCGVSLTSNKLEDRLMSEVQGCFMMVDNTPTDGFEVVKLSHWDYGGTNEADPFLAMKHGTSKKVVIRDPRGFIFGMSRWCYKSEYANVNPGQRLPNSLVYVWPASKKDVDDGPWLVPADHPVAVRARSFSDAVDKKDAFAKVQDMKVLGVYTVAQGTHNGRKMAFLGCVPYVKVHEQAHQILTSAATSKKLKPVPKKAIFAWLDFRIDIVRIMAFAEAAADKMFLKTDEPEKIPDHMLKQVLAAASRVEKSIQANPVDPNVVLKEDRWQPFNADSFVETLDCSGSRWVKECVFGKATAVEGQPVVLMRCVYDAQQLSVAMHKAQFSKIHHRFVSQEQSISFCVKQCKPSDVRNELAAALKDATSKLKLVQLDLGTPQPPHAMQLAWYTAFREFLRLRFNSLSLYTVAEAAGQTCVKAVCKLRI